MADNFYGYEPGFGKHEQIGFIIKHLGLPSDEVLFVGDSMADYDFVRDDEVNFIGISRTFPKEEFIKKGLSCVSSLSSLTKLFDKSEKYHNSVEMTK